MVPGGQKAESVCRERPLAGVRLREPQGPDHPGASEFECFTQSFTHDRAGAAGKYSREAIWGWGGGDGRREAQAGRQDILPLTSSGTQQPSSSRLAAAASTERS